MPDASKELARFVSAGLGKLADSAKAPAMAAYMRTDQPFYGVPKPAREPLFREMCALFAPGDQRAYERGVLALWKLTRREEQYAAIDYARHHRRFIGVASMGLYEQMVREGAWWDFVDDIAANLVGTVLLAHRGEIAPLIDRWVDDGDFWIRRTALLAQLHHKKRTDAKRLFDYCIRRADESEFFIRKAIGWALREYSKSEPRAVREFLLKHRKRLSPLSFREGAKRLAAAGEMKI